VAQTPQLLPEEGELMLKIARRLAASGCAVDTTDERGRTALSYAIQHDYYDLALMFVSSGADLHYRDLYHRRPLDYLSQQASWSGWQPMVAFITKLGAPVDLLNKLNGRGRTSVHSLCEMPICSRSLYLLDWMLSNGAEAALLDNDGNTPHHILLGNRIMNVGSGPRIDDISASVIRSFMKGCSTGVSYRAALDMFIRHFFQTGCPSAHLCALEVISEVDADPQDQTVECREASENLAVSLLDKMPKPNGFLMVHQLLQHNRKRRLPTNGLMIIKRLCSFDQLETAKILVRFELTEEQAHAAFVAVTKVEALDYLLSSAQGLHLNCQDLQGKSALHSSCEKSSDAGWIEILLERGADPNMQDHLSNTALHAASSRHTLCPNIIEVLLSHGANLNVLNRLGNPALHLVCADRYHDHGKRLQSMLLLLNHGADPNGQNGSGKTALHYMFEEFLWAGDTSLKEVELLLGKGTDPNIQDHSGETVLHGICSNENSRYSFKGVSFWGSEQFMPMIELLSKFSANVQLRNKSNQQAVDLFTSHNIKRA
jgi:ankyrin repeat protein